MTGLQQAKALQKHFEKSHQPILSRCKHAINLARYLQGRLTSTNRQAFIAHLTSCDTCLGELAFSLKDYEPAPIEFKLTIRLHSLITPNSASSSTLGRSREVYGEASTSSGEKPAFLNLDAEDLPADEQMVRRERRKTGRMHRRPTAEHDLPNTKKQSTPDTAADSYQTQPLDVEEVIRSQDQISGLHGALTREPPARAKVSLTRSLLFSLLGAGFVFAVGVAPLIAISKRLFIRARKNEIELAKARKFHDKIKKAYAIAKKRISTLDKELDTRASFEDMKRLENTTRILRSSFKHSREAYKKLEKRHKAELLQLDKRYKQALANQHATLTKRAEAEFPDRFFNAIAGQGYPKAPKTAVLIELVKTSNDKAGVAAFLSLEQRKLRSLAVILAGKRSKLSLLHFLARPYLAILTTEDRHWDLLACLLHDDVAVRKASYQALKNISVDIRGYAVDLSNKDMNSVVASMAQVWLRKYSKTKGPYNLPFRPE